MKKTLSMFVVTGLLATAGAAVAAERYVIESNHTYPSFRAPHLGISWWMGKFNKTTGNIVLDRANRTGEVDIVIDASSIDFGHDKMNEHAKSPDFFNVAQYPEIRYKGKLKFDGEQPVAVEGTLDMIGQSKPVMLKINSFKCIQHPMLKREVCGADVEGEFNRRDFGMNFLASTPEAGVAKLAIQVEALKE